MAKGNVYEVKDIQSGQVLIWGEEEMLQEINRDRSNDWSDYNSDDLLEGWIEWCEGDIYTLLSKNGRSVFNTPACKDTVESMLFDIFRLIGIDFPNNHEDITQFCYEDIMDTADPDNWHSGDVNIAFRRFLELKNN